MNELRQRQPRVTDEAWLAEVRKLPCTICHRPGPNDPAHIRAPSIEHNKRYTGKAEKPSDCWVLPLCRMHHDEQHRGNELAFWLRYGIDPFATAVALYASWPGINRPKRERRQIVKTVTRKPKSERQSIHSRGFPEVHRPIVQRNNLRKRATPIKDTDNG